MTNSFYENFVKSVQSNSLNSDIKNKIIPLNVLSPQEAIQVYHRDYYSRLTEVLGEIYETLWCLLGDDDFFDLSAEYIKNSPSKSPNLNNIGANFPTFLEKKKELPRIAIDVARFEWAFNQCFHAEDPSRELNIEPISSNPMEFVREKCHIQSACNLVDANYNVYSLWKLRKEGFSSLVDIEEKKNYACFFKFDRKVRIWEISENEFSILHHLKQGHTIERAIETLNDSLKQEEISQFFAQVFRLKLILGRK